MSSMGQSPKKQSENDPNNPINTKFRPPNPTPHIRNLTTPVLVDYFYVCIIL